VPGRAHRDGGLSDLWLVMRDDSSGHS
jgi:hypothetical protein